MAEINQVSPLAPKAGFPDLPEIAGVEFAAVQAGVKYSNRNDVMLARICKGASIAGVFTKSSTRAAPVLDCQDKLSTVTDPEKGFAIVVNSGNANAFTGGRGIEAVKQVCETASEVLDLPAAHIYTSSTGVIGEPLPAEKICNVLTSANEILSANAIEQAAQAIMTTDTYTKGAGRTLSIGGETVSISGFAKGSGMIAPDMATMLVYIFTDAKIGQSALQSMLSRLNEKTFNCITVDSDTSTSDSLLFVATGTSQVDAEGSQEFEDALHQVMLDLAHQVVKDGEGATKFVEVSVEGASTKSDAKLVASAIANSPLVKTAIAGEDPNWGRIVMAVGKSGALADRDKLSISFGDILVAEKGWVNPTYEEASAAAYMKNKELVIRVDLGVGNETATVWTCDLTHQYISINADYRS